jgi:tetraacyldisaccharide 4'-kinase
VGNLSVGGTGKSPMIELLIKLLWNQYKVAVISRGYKRKTKGYALANPESTALDIGDEPLQFHLKFPDVPIAVGEARIIAIPELLQDKPDTEVILLDDAFQHRSVRAGLNILLTDYNNLFTRDFFLPTGDLRDLRSSYKRAEIIIVTKCKPDLTEEEKKELIREINPQDGQEVFFSCIQYGQPYHLITNKSVSLNNETEVLLVTGIANPKPLESLLMEYCDTYERLSYPDHHVFVIDDMNEIQVRFEKLDAEKKIILTTEKDGVRLLKFHKEIEKLPLFVIPIQHQIMFDDEKRFAGIVVDFLNNFKNGLKK